MAQARSGSLGPPYLSSLMSSDDQLASTFDTGYEPSKEERLRGDNGLLAGLYNATIEASTLCLRQHVPPPVPASDTLGPRVLRSGRIIKAENAAPREAVHRKLNGYVAQLVLWGDAISSEKASFLAASASDLYRNVAELLRDCGKGIQRLCRKLATDIDSISREFSILESWLEKVDYVLEADAESSSDNESDGESLRSTPSEADPGDDVEVLGENVALLMDLLPSIADVSNIKEANSNLEVSSRIAFEVSAPAQSWISQIADNYKNAPNDVVKRLGEANWQRFCRLRMREDEGLAKQLEKAKSVFCPSWHDSGIGSSLQPTEVAHSTASHSSFASSMAVDTHHYNRVPPEPPEVALGKPFMCPVCEKRVSNVHNRIGWKIHLFDDLKPYICLHEGCDHVLFSTRKTWFDHELQEHRQKTIYECRDCHTICEEKSLFQDHVDVFHENPNPAQRSILVAAAAQVKTERIRNWVCPLCKKTDFNTERKYTSHVCAHMEDIALTTLPRDVYGADDEPHEEESSSTEGMEDEYTRCICGATSYPGVDERDNFLIQCDDCHVWQHGACVLPDQTRVPDNYYCEQCRTDENEVGKAQDRAPAREPTLDQGHLVSGTSTADIGNDLVGRTSTDEADQTCATDPDSSLGSDDDKMILFSNLESYPTTETAADTLENFDYETFLNAPYNVDFTSSAVEPSAVGHFSKGFQHLKGRLYPSIDLHNVDDKRSLQNQQGQQPQQGQARPQMNPQMEQLLQNYTMTFFKQAITLEAQKYSGNPGMIPGQVKHQLQQNAQKMALQQLGKMRQHQAQQQQQQEAQKYGGNPGMIPNQVKQQLQQNALQRTGEMRQHAAQQLQQQQQQSQQMQNGMTNGQQGGQMQHRQAAWI
ncbi:hypothetical protein LTR51_003736 [Lithohypha guttulata]|nr:hypothetical protein LTR51_003736 [Lithohypha guttulata]